MKSKAPALMRESAQLLREIFQEGLAEIGAEIIRQVMANYKALAPKQRARAINDNVAWIGENAYRALVLNTMAEISFDAIQGARKEVPGTARIKLSEEIDSIKFNEETIFERLPKELQLKLRKRSELLVGTQLADLQKTIFFQYLNSYDTSDDARIVAQDVKEAAAEYISGSAITSGADLTATSVVNTARNAFFIDSEVQEQLDAFQFVNGDPVTPICSDLEGTVFAVDDPDLFKYTPPLHWNCKSYIVPIVKGNLGGREIEKLKPSTKALDDSIQFAEHLNHAHAGTKACAHCGK